MAMTYHVEYDGYYTMKWHDDEQNALKRWFDNYKLDKYVSFASGYEWLVVKEVSTDTKRKVRMICEIGNDGEGTKREVIMDHTAPPAPMLTFAAKKRYEPPPPKTEQQIRKEIEWDIMTALGYVPIRRPVQPIPTFIGLDYALKDSLTMEYKIEWQLSPQPYFDFKPDFSEKPKPPKAPTHRRNV